jgi:hypothetical protein
VNGFIEKVKVKKKRSKKNQMNIKTLIKILIGWLLAFSYGFIFGIKPNATGLIICLCLIVVNVLKLLDSNNSKLL